MISSQEVEEVIDKTNPMTWLVMFYTILSALAAIVLFIALIVKVWDFIRDVIYWQKQRNPK